MSVVIFILWLVAFIGGVLAAYFVPVNVLSMDLKFVFIGAVGVPAGRRALLHLQEEAYQCRG
jgi:hypothetical protein